MESPTLAGNNVLYEDPEPEKAKQAKKKARGVRFQTDEGEVILPEKFDRLERSSSRPRAAEALDYLLAGNRRFREGRLERCVGGPDIIQETAEDVAKPSTIILSCSDSRAPPELVCDMGLGDCHVVRVGGNVVNDFVLGSILFAVQHVGVTLVVVMAHSRCSVVASAVQSWARGSNILVDGDEARSLAETVQQTLGNSPSLPSNQPIDRSLLTNSLPPTPELKTPFASVSSEPYKEESFFGKCCSCFSSSGQTTSETAAVPPVSGASTPMRTQGAGVSTDRRRVSSDHREGSHHGQRHHIGRQSINPLNALVGAIGGVVEAVASSGQHESLKGLAKKEKQAQKDRGYDSDDEDLKRGLQKQDSLEFTRARLAKSRQDKKMTAIRHLAERDDVDCIIDENAKVSATTILKGIVKNLDAEIVQNVEVVAAKYDIATGSVRVLSRHWYSQQHKDFCSSMS